MSSPRSLRLRPPPAFSGLWCASARQAKLTRQLDSLLGATLQQTLVDSKTGRVVSTPSGSTRVVSGRDVLSNNAVRRPVGQTPAEACSGQRDRVHGDSAGHCPRGHLLHLTGSARRRLAVNPGLLERCTGPSVAISHKLPLSHPQSLHGSARTRTGAIVALSPCAAPGPGGHSSRRIAPPRSRHDARGAGQSDRRDVRPRYRTAGASLWSPHRRAPSAEDGAASLIISRSTCVLDARSGLETDVGCSAGAVAVVPATTHRPNSTGWPMRS